MTPRFIKVIGISNGVHAIPVRGDMMVAAERDGAIVSYMDCGYQIKVKQSVDKVLAMIQPPNLAHPPGGEWLPLGAGGKEPAPGQRVEVRGTRVTDGDPYSESADYYADEWRPFPLDKQWQWSRP